jgi:predicted nucleic acid-binding protein
VTVYLDSSALLKRYLDERGSSEAERILASDSSWATAYLTLAEVRGALFRNFTGLELKNARAEFELDWARIAKIEVDRLVCARAADIVEMTGVRTLDAIHLASAHRAGAPDVPIATFDARMARAARELEWPVLGA